MKSVVLIGATGGIGYAVLKRLSKSCNIFATSTSMEKIESIKKNFDSNVHFEVFDQCAKSEKELLKKANEVLGKIDSLVVVSGITSDGLCMRLSDEMWDMTIEINLSSSFRLARESFRYISKNGGSMIFTSSVIARLGNAGQVAYAASKGGLEAMVRTLAREFASRNIRVNSIAPGFIETKMTENLDQSKLLSAVPLGKMGTVEDVAAAFDFLINEGSYITGHTLEVNGGLWMA